MENKHIITEAYLQSLTEDEKMRQMETWGTSDWTQYYSLGGTKTLEEFRVALINKCNEMIREKYGSDNIK